MKIRQGFVSNSSSSSFLIVGADWTDLSLEAQEKLTGTKHGGYYNGGHGQFDCNDPHLIIVGDDEPRYVGFDIEESLNRGETVPDLKVKLLTYLFKHYKADTLPELIYGEFGN